MDVCPGGDLSPSFYDGSCVAVPAGTGSSTTTGTTTTGSTTTGTTTTGTTTPTITTSL
jgi:hypothetical protein